MDKSNYKEVRRRWAIHRGVKVLREWDDRGGGSIAPSPSRLIPLTQQMEQKLQYARWKAADGAKALREGRLPNSGPRECDPQGPHPLPSA